MTATSTVPADHPAPFSPAVIDAIGRLLKGYEGELILDPWAGTGRIHALPARYPAVGVELEWEWACQRPGRPMVQANTFRLPFRTGALRVVATSPCLEQSYRLLTDDLRWVACGDLEVGDGVLAFDEAGRPGTMGRASRRRWQRTEIIRSSPRSVKCLRVILSNGDEITTTPEHPWLAYRYAYGNRAAEWIASADLAPRRPGLPFYVMRQVEPWVRRTSYDAGWLAGLFDGEGSLSLGVHGSPKLQVCQVLGPVLERAERLMEAFGYQPNRIVRTGEIAGRQKVGNLYVTGGFPGLLRALGELRPGRLLEKWADLDISSRTVQAEKVAVLAVEDAGRREIQEIETAEGTYLGEGYLMHNSYGNRYADAHENRDLCKTCKGEGTVRGHTCKQCRGKRLSRRRSYRHDLGRMPHDDNSGLWQWGPKYRSGHETMLDEVLRVLNPDLGGGDWNLPSAFILNISDHYREKVIQPVTDWWVETMGRRGMIVEGWKRIATSRMKQGANRDARVPYENVILFTDARRSRLPLGVLAPWSSAQPVTVTGHRL